MLAALAFIKSWAVTKPVSTPKKLKPAPKVCPNGALYHHLLILYHKGFWHYTYALPTWPQLCQPSYHHDQARLL